MPLDEKDQQRIEQHIRTAFDGVARAGGVSWSESVVIDGWGDEEACAEARARDTERRWLDLVDDPQWDPEGGVGGFSFLDAIGFRYYLAPAMIRAVRSGLDNGVRYFLTLDSTNDKWRLEKLSLLDERQRSCVTRFLRFMADWSQQQGWDLDAGWWRGALASYWATQET